MGDLGRVALVVHQEQVHLPGVADQELLQAVREHMPGLQNVGEDVQGRG